MYISNALRPQRGSDEPCHMRFKAGPAWSIPVVVATVRSVEMLLLLLAGLFVAAHLEHPQHGTAGLRFEVMLATLATTEVLRIGGASTLARLKSLSGNAPIMVGAVAAGMLLVFVSLLSQGSQPRAALVWSVAWGGVTAGTLLTSRIAAAAAIGWLGARGRLANKVAVIGDGSAAEAVARRFLKEDPVLLRLIGRYSLGSPATGFTERPANQSNRGDLGMLLLDCRLGGVDSIVMVTPPTDAAALASLEGALKNFAIDIYMLPEDADLAGPAARPAALGKQPMLLVNERPLKDWRGLAKNAFDRVCAAFILLLIAPVLVAVAALIRLDSPGPILFRQMRVGYNNQLFHIFKFRTMHAHATDRLATLQTTRGDVRVTRVGRVLRQLSIDELPQLFNVLLGNMSLVGPRPHAPGTSAAGQRVDLLLDNYNRRHLVKPGITGLAQVRGFRGGMTTVDQVSRRVQCDLEYIRRQSLWLDLKIMAMTLVREVGGGRAF